MARNNQAQDRYEPPGVSTSRDYETWRFEDIPVNSLFWISTIAGPQNLAYRKTSETEGLHVKTQQVREFKYDEKVFELI